MGLYLAEHYDTETLRGMGVRGLPPAAPMPPPRAPRAVPRGRTSGAVQTYASAAEAPPHLQGAAEQIRRREWLKKGSTEAGIAWLTGG